jgi:hypothetical protein
LSNAIGIVSGSVGLTFDPPPPPPPPPHPWIVKAIADKNNTLLFMRNFLVSGFQVITAISILSCK